MIVEYKNANDVTILFDNGYTVKTTYGNFKVGEILNLYDRTLCGVGYLGKGEYNASINNKLTPEYNHWRAMIERCYKKSKDRPTYLECTVCDEWHCFQTFAKWYEENYYKVDDEVMCLDKDILNKGNKIYSPENCILVPNDINVLFTKRQNNRGKYPIGVSWHKRDKIFYAACSFGRGRSRTEIGRYNNPIDAFYAYKKVKENYIRQVADKYKDKIPSKLYEALYRYEVEITD